MVTSRLKVFLPLFVLAVSCLNEDIDRKGFCDGSLTLTITSIAQPTSCSSGGAINVTAKGNYPPFKFSHNGGVPQSTGQFTDIPPGTHTISVIDVNECTVTQENIVVNTPASSTLALETLSIAGDDSCSSDNGSVTLNGTGGNGALLYSFDNSSFTSKVTYSSLAPGIYDAQVKDAQGCISSKSITIERKSTNTSWVNDVKPVLANKCVTCHPGAGTLDDWGKYSSVFSKRSTIRTRVSTGTMPPAGNTQLTASEKALIVCWIDDGAPEN